MKQLMNNWMPDSLPLRTERADSLSGIFLFK